jgi:drug/metabolite transporter (DMT)-like permease
VAALRVVLVSYPIALTLLTVIAAMVGGEINLGAVFWGGLCGVSQAFGIWWFYAALGAGPISVVSPLTAILVAGIPVGVGLATGERPGPVAAAGVVLALVAVVLVSRQVTDEPRARRATDSDEPRARRATGTDEPRARRATGTDEPRARRATGTDEPRARRATNTDKDVTRHRFTATVAWLTVGSGVAFGLNFVLIHQAPVEARLWPLVFARLSASVLVLVIAAVSGNLRPPTGTPLRLAVLAAVLDAGANIAMLLALQASYLSLAGVLMSLYPAATVLLAIAVLRERLTRWQAVGMVLALVSVAMIAAG